MCDIIQTNQINIYPQLFCCNHNVCEHDAEIKFVVFAKQSAMSDSLFGKDMDTVFINDKTPRSKSERHAIVFILSVYRNLYPWLMFFCQGQAPDANYGSKNSLLFTEYM